MIASTILDLIKYNKSCGGLKFAILALAQIGIKSGSRIEPDGISKKTVV